MRWILSIPGSGRALYIGQDKYPFRVPGGQRITFVITPEHVRYVKQ